MLKKDDVFVTCDATMSKKDVVFSSVPLSSQVQAIVSLPTGIAELKPSYGGCEEWVMNSNLAMVCVKSCPQNGK